MYPYIYIYIYASKDDTLRFCRARAYAQTKLRPGATSPPELCHTNGMINAGQTRIVKRGYCQFFRCTCVI